jgi:hypothetical protein
MIHTKSDRATVLQADGMQEIRGSTSLGSTFFISVFGETVKSGTGAERLAGSFSQRGQDRPDAAVRTASGF